MRQIFFACVSLILLVGCDTFGKQYVYVPRAAGEKPATITAISTVKSKDTSMLGIAPSRTIQAHVMRINQAFTRAGAKSLDIAQAGDAYQLSPGKNTIEVNVTITVIPGPRINPTTVPLTIDAKPGEAYRIGATESASNDYGIWIEDSRGKRVASAQFRVGR